MFSLSPSPDDRNASSNLEKLLVRQIEASTFTNILHSLRERFLRYAATCPEPLAAAGLDVTPEIRRQSELYLPLAGIARAFSRLYRAALTYQPILESTPFHNALSWADVYAALPQRFRFNADPSRMLEALLINPELLREFLFLSFLPRRFYGAFRRYPGQSCSVQSWLGERAGTAVRCLDAACGTGEGCYDLALILLENGFQTSDFMIEGWTIEPLEVWAAAHARFPHDPSREAQYQRETAAVFGSKAFGRMIFRTVDLKAIPGGFEFDLILCNGLLGGPIVHHPDDILHIVSGLTGLLAPGGRLLASDSFHGGWTKKIPGELLGDLFRTCGLSVCDVGEGIGGIRT